MLTTERLVPANKAHFEAVMGLAARVFDGVEQLTDLNLRLIKTALGEVTESGLAALSAQDPQSLLAWPVSLLQPTAEKASAFGRQLQSIVAGITADVGKLIAEQAAATQSSFVDAVSGGAVEADSGAKRYRNQGSKT